MKLNVGAFALAFGIWWGGGVFLMTWWLLLTGDTAVAPVALDRLYIGYDISPLGSVIGLVYGVICGAICGAILAWLYNILTDRLGERTSTHGAYSLNE